MKKIILTLIFSLATFIIFAQNQYFADTNYIGKLKDYVSPVFKNYPDYEDVFNNFEKLWKGGSLENMKFGIVYVSNEMLKNDALPYPAFYFYLSSINKLASDNNLDFYREWEVGLMNITDNRKVNKINDYLQFSYLLIHDSILVQSPSITWKVITKNFEIQNDPQTEQLFVSFNEDVDLICYYTKNTKIDTLRISQTNGVCYPVEKKFIGKHGRIYWTNFGYNPNDVFAKFSDFKIDMIQGKVDIENALYSNSNLGVYQVPGKLSARLVVSANERNTPQFDSYNILELKKLFPDVYFKGYLEVQGGKIKGLGKENPALMIVSDKNKKVVQIKSFNFDLNKQTNKPGDTAKIYSASASVCIYFNSLQDSIWHNNVMIRYSPILNTKLFDTLWFNNTKFNFKNGYYLDIQRSAQGLGLSPFVDTYHCLNIFNDRILWRKSDSLFYFLTTFTSSSEYSSFQSQNYFDQQEFDYFSGKNSDDLNHLFAVNELSKQRKIFSPADYQKYVSDNYQKQLSMNSIRQLFQEMSYSGFVIYDRINDLITPTNKIQKFLNYDLRTKLKSSKYDDYDNIMIISQIGQQTVKGSNLGINATLNLQTSDLKIFHTLPIKLSPTVKVYATEVNVQKNRKMYFPTGYIGAGMSKYTDTSGFIFNYDKFSIDISNSNAEFWTADTVNKDIYLSHVSSLLQNINATILINSPNNKSNTIYSPEYPKLHTSSTSNIYYEKFKNKYEQKDKKNKFNDVFYFEANNFDFNSLNNINDSNLVIDGIMHTGLFHDLPVQLSVKHNNQGEKYLGFEECTGTNQSLKNGLELKDGKFFGCFGLSDQGLYGNGYILYGSAYCQSKSFAFLPEEVIGDVDSFYIDNSKLGQTNLEDIAVVKGVNAAFNFKGEMTFSTQTQKNSEITIYNNKLQDKAGVFRGTLKYTINNTHGNGTFDFSDATLIDSNFSFKSTFFDAKECDFKLKIAQKTAFDTKNLTGHVDLNEQLGSFYSNNDTSRIYFPYHNYYCVMDHFLWKIGEGIVNIGGIMPGSDTTDYVTSVEQKQKNNKKDIKLFGTIMVNTIDSLTFNASATTYKIEEQKVIADNVQRIKIADALIYPHCAITILKGGTIDTIKNISLEFPFNIFDENKKTNNTFVLHNAYILIRNRYNYDALRPVYSYPYNNQDIAFDLVDVKNAPVKYDPKTIVFDSLYSSGYKNFQQKDSIWLNKNFVYSGSGKVVISAKNKYLTFEGFVRIDSACHNIFAVKSFHIDPIEINPDTVILPLNYTCQSATPGNAFSGIYWTYSAGKYSIIPLMTAMFENGRTLGSDNAKAWKIITPDGFINNNKLIGEYRLADDKRMFYTSRPDTINGNFIALNNQICTFKAQGEFNMFLPWDMIYDKDIRHIRNTFKGVYRYNIDTKTQIFQGVWAFDFVLPNEILTTLAQLILDNPENTTTFTANHEQLTKNYYIFMGKDKTDQLFTQLGSEYTYNVPKELEHSIVFTNVTLAFSPDSSALMTIGNVGIGTINGQAIDRYVSCKILYTTKENFPRFLMVFKPSPGKVIGIDYIYKDNQGMMKVYLHTGDDTFDQTIINMKKKQISKDYQYIDEDYNTMYSFMKDFLNN